MNDNEQVTDNDGLQLADGSKERDTKWDELRELVMQTPSP